MYTVLDDLQFLFPMNLEILRLALRHYYMLSCPLVERYAFVSVAVVLRFESRAGQIERSIANGSPPLQQFFERSGVVRARKRENRSRKLVTHFGVI